MIILIIAHEHLTVDLGIPEHIREVQVTFPMAGNLDFDLQLSYDKDDENSWTTLESVTSFTSTTITFTGPWDIAGRYLRLSFVNGYSFQGGYPPGSYFSISKVKVWRMPRVTGTNPTNTYCESNALRSTR